MKVDLVDFYWGDITLGTPIIDVTIYDANGIAVQPQNDIEICFHGTETDDPCLGVLNELNNEWECEDACLEEDNDGMYCGNTPHLSRFTLLLDPGGISGNERCGSDSWDGITPTSWGDVILIVSVCLLVFCFGIIVIVVVTLVPSLHGAEHVRISTLRNHQSHMSALASVEPQ